MWLMPTAYPSHVKNRTTAISDKYVLLLGIPGCTFSIFIFLVVWGFSRLVVWEIGRLVVWEISRLVVWEFFN
jgi:hypothetical protein